MLRPWCSFEVVSGKSGDPYSIKVRSSSVFKGGLARNLVLETSFEGLILPARRAHCWSYIHSVWLAWHFRDMFRSKPSLCVTGAGHRTLFHTCGRHSTFCMLLKRWQAWVKMRGGFGAHFSWQAQILVNLE